MLHTLDILFLPEAISYIHTYLYVRDDRYLDLVSMDHRPLQVSCLPTGDLEAKMQLPNGRWVKTSFAPTMAEWAHYLQQLKNTPSTNPDAFPSLWSELRAIAWAEQVHNSNALQYEPVPDAGIYCCSAKANDVKEDDK